jgi:cell wall integrity and stress response component
MQDAACWCSNYAPEQTTNIFDCDEGCPGYPQDSCGGDSGLLFAYEVVLDRLPSGTATGALAAASSTSTVQQVSAPHSHVP